MQAEWFPESDGPQIGTNGSSDTDQTITGDDLADGVDYEVVKTASGGFDSKKVDTRTIQVPSGFWDNLSLSDGDFLKIIATHNGNQVESYGRCEERGNEFENPLQSETVAVGIGIRQAVGANIGDTVTVTKPGFQPVSIQRRSLNRILKIRPGHCRVYKAVFPDVGRKTCRLPSEFAEYLGINWGDRIVIQSAESRIRGMKALPLSDSQRQRIQKRQKANPEAYPTKYELISSEKLKKDDVPPIYLSGGARSDLSLTDTDVGTVLQPVKIHRDTRDVLARVVSDLTIPLLIGVATIIVTFDLDRFHLTSFFITGIVLIIYTLWFRTRHILLE